MEMCAQLLVPGLTVDKVVVLCILVNAYTTYPCLVLVIQARARAGLHPFSRWGLKGQDFRFWDRALPATQFCHAIRSKGCAQQRVQRHSLLLTSDIS